MWKPGSALSVVVALSCSVLMLRIDKLFVFQNMTPDDKEISVKPKYNWLFFSNGIIDCTSISGNTVLVDSTFGVFILDIGSTLIMLEFVVVLEALIAGSSVNGIVDSAVSRLVLCHRCCHSSRSVFLFDVLL